MITHCPSCHTHFRVHAEQLAARAGQVRCGKCSRVFNALEHLIEEIVPAHLPPSAPEPEIEKVEIVAADPLQEAPQSQAASAATDMSAPEVPMPADAAAETIAEAVEKTTKDSATSESATEASLPEFDSPGPAKIEAEAGTGASSFDFGPGVKADSAKRGRRWPWLLGALFLLLTLLAQALYQYRSAIVLLVPEAKPYAAALCAKMGCDLPLPRRIELMSIDASDLQADTTNPNVMVLSATLKNRAVFNQQHPLLELTLTDAQDQPVVRRVLTPQDYLGKTVSMQAGFAANADVAIKVFIEGSQVKATGYRLYLFYP
jgi:predicted Zn finger-like uncharacterized protein